MIEVVEYRKKEVEVDYDWKDDKIVVHSVKDTLTGENLKYKEETIVERLEDHFSGQREQAAEDDFHAYHEGGDDGSWS